MPARDQHGARNQGANDEALAVVNTPAAQTQGPSTGDRPMTDTGAAFTEQFLADQEALERFRGGDQSAYGELFGRYRGVAVGYARRYTATLDDAEDLAQDAFARVLQALRRGRGPTVSMGHYLLTAVRSIATDCARRKTPVEQPTDTAVLARLCEHEQQEPDDDVADWMVTGFNKLSRRQQEVVWNHAVEGRTFTSIAPDLSISIASASRDYSSAMRTLRASFAASAAAHSRDPDCARVSTALVERSTKWKSEVRSHVRGCADCRSVARRLHSKDRKALAMALLAGLGGLGVEALRAPSEANALAAWWARLSTGAKVWGVVALAAVLLVGGVVAGFVADAGGGAGEWRAPLGSAAANNTIVASTETCELVRAVAGEGREVWQLHGDGGCAADVRYRADPVGSHLRLGAAGAHAARGCEVARAGEYRVEVWDSSSRNSVTVRIPQADRATRAARDR